MGNDDWCRRTTWSQTDREAFHARLRRSRSEGGKAQYLRIQALHLQQTGDPERIAAAVELLDELVAKYPDRTQIAQAHVQRAECLDALDRASDAIVSFRAGIASQRELPGVRTRVALVFGMFCLRRDLVGLLEEVAAYVNELADESPFPRDVFEANAVLALSHAHRGDAKTARAYAEAAIAAAGRTTSGVTSHAGLGLVEHVDPRLVSKLPSEPGALAPPTVVDDPALPRAAITVAGHERAVHLRTFGDPASPPLLGTGTRTIRRSRGLRAGGPGCRPGQLDDLDKWSRGSRSGSGANPAFGAQARDGRKFRVIVFEVGDDHLFGEPSASQQL